jgi:hypothetical protein
LLSRPRHPREHRPEAGLGTEKSVPTEPLPTAKLVLAFSPLFSFQGSAHCRFPTAKIIIQRCDLTVKDAGPERRGAQQSGTPRPVGQRRVKV